MSIHSAIKASRAASWQYSWLSHVELYLLIHGKLLFNPAILYQLTPLKSAREILIPLKGIESLRTFMVLGQSMAKALMDSRSFDIFLSRTFAQLVSSPRKRGICLLLSLLNTTCIQQTLNHLATEELSVLGLDDKLQDRQNPTSVIIIYNLIHSCCISSHSSLLFSFLSFIISILTISLKLLRLQVCLVSFTLPFIISHLSFPLYQVCSFFLQSSRLLVYSQLPSLSKSLPACPSIRAKIESCWPLEASLSGKFFSFKHKRF
ncbi:hypothetical protein VP01_1042g1 [Puccinia sorghi]|uniref:Uncharacterized protein n=1 Tax=Puccinia sorghi TaxID=27349 RepID=A0A0L6VUD8_9BASI|nr:hypothetical protein VP01_1042g1 [Puccinia sorghi]